MELLNKLKLLKESERRDILEYRADKNEVLNRLVDFYQFDIFGFCTCGSSEENLRYVFAVLLGFIEIELENPALKEERFWRGESTTENLFVLYWLDYKGLAGHGGSVYGSWLEDSGKELKHDLKLLIEEIEKCNR